MESKLKKGISGKGQSNGYDGEFGKGGDSANDGNADGGGSGYFGGGGGATSPGVVGSGAGGSSFVSGLEGCKAILKSSTKDNLMFSEFSFHYSGLVFTNITTQDGKITQCKNGGDGKVEIRFLSSLRDKYLTSKYHFKGIGSLIFFVIVAFKP